ncbi:hypothetical protein [Kocuria sp. U4B]
MGNEKVTYDDGVPVDEITDRQAELAELTERIHVLTLERGIAVRMRNNAIVAMHQDGHTVEDLADWAGMHIDDVKELVRGSSKARRKL